jgi:hypothetical protein
VAAEAGFEQLLAHTQQQQQQGLPLGGCMVGSDNSSCGRLRSPATSGETGRRVCACHLHLPSAPPASCLHKPGCCAGMSLKADYALLLSIHAHMVLQMFLLHH